MKSIEVPETKTATFQCEVSHFNVPATWLKNGVEIEMTDKFKIVVQGKLHQLIIMNTSHDDSAEYTFICGNDKISATLTVKRKTFSLIYTVYPCLKFIFRYCICNHLGVFYQSH